MKLKLPPLVHNLAGIVQAEVGPEVLPASGLLLAVSLGFFILVQFMAKLVTHSVAGAAGIGITAAVFLSVVAIVSARLLGHKERLLQTLTALAASGAVVAFVNFLCRGFLRIGFHVMLEDEGPVESMTDFLLFPIFLWNIVLYAGIFRRAFGVGLLLAFALSFTCVLTLFFEIPHFFK